MNTHHVEENQSCRSLLLAGWALYITVVTASNLSDLFWAFHWENWAFRSGNLAYIATATRIYFKTEQANQALLALVIVWEAAAVVSCGWLRCAGRAAGRRRSAAPGAASVLLGLLWFGFAISAELFVAYDRGVNESAYWIRPWQYSPQWLSSRSLAPPAELKWDLEAYVDILRTAMNHHGLRLLELVMRRSSVRFR